MDFIGVTGQRNTLIFQKRSHDTQICLAPTPVVNRGDNMMLAFNTTAILGGKSENVNILGNVILEEGALRYHSIPYTFFICESDPDLQQE